MTYLAKTAILTEQAPTPSDDVVFNDGLYECASCSFRREVGNGLQSII